MNAQPRTFEAKPAVRRCPVSPSYEVSEDGRVRRIGKADWLRLTPAARGGYLQVSLWESGKGKTWKVHRLVALTFLDPPPSPNLDVAHYDGDKTNNHRSNLRWASRAENEGDKLRHGRSNRGERNGGAKLTDAQARELAARGAALPRSSGGTRIKKGALPSLAREYGISKSAAWQILDGRRRSAS